MTENATFTYGARVLLQVDLEGHSAWVAAASSKPAVSHARRDFAQTLHQSLATFGFQLLSWKGDGGVYQAQSEGRQCFDFSVEAALQAAADFDAWRHEKPDRSNLRLRISLHHAPDIYIHKDDGYWTSDHLNVFLKYERELGVSGTVAVTQGVFRNLSGEKQGLFDPRAARRRTYGVRPGEAIITETHYAPLPGEAALNRASKTGFFEWLNVVLPEASTIDSSVGPASMFRASLGDASFLFAAPHPESPLSIELVQRDTVAVPDLTEEDREKWKTIQAELGPDGPKVSVLQIVRPLTDVPLARIEYCVDGWIRARAFHLLLEANSSLRDRFAKEVLNAQESGFNYPNIACCHAIVRTADAGTPQVLLCQRQRKGQNDAYFPGHWSISFEEQLRPHESVEACVRRGLAEELLGDQGVSGATIRIVGAIIEKGILNPAFIVLVDVPLTLLQIADSWRHAVDKDEHRQLAAIALTTDGLRRLAGSCSIDPQVSALIQPAAPEIYTSNDSWDLHPTAVARAAMYLWSHGES